MIFFLCYTVIEVMFYDCLVVLAYFRSDFMERIPQANANAPALYSVSRVG
jgi:hypothetical protein